MAIRWKTAKREEAVSELIRRFPFDSNRCDDLAREVMPHAQRVDPEAAARILRNATRTRRLFLVPRAPTGHRIYAHVVVDADDHFLDALTGPSGELRGTYLESKWEYTDSIAVEPHNLDGPIL